MVGGAEDGGQGGLDRRRHVHEAGIVGHKGVAGGDQRHGRQEFGLTGHVQGRALTQILDNGGGAGIGVGAEDHAHRPGFAPQPGGQFSVFFRGPALGRAIGGPWVETDDRPVGPVGGQEFFRLGHDRGRQANFQAVRPLFQPEILHQSLVIMNLMNAAPRLGNRHPVGEQGTAQVPAVAGPAGNPGPPGEKGGFEGVLQENGEIEFFFPQFRRQTQHSLDSGVTAAFFIKNDLIDMGTGDKDIRHPGVDQNGDMGLGKILPNGAHRRGGHHRVADPVGGTNEDLFRGEGKNGCGGHEYRQSG